MGSIIPPGGIPPPATIPGPPPTGPVDILPAVIPGGSGGSPPPTTIGAPPESLPPPPVLEPLTGITSGATSPDSVVIRIYRWKADEYYWQAIDWFQQGWRFWPAGWYASSHQDADGNVDWGPHSTVFLVLERKDPSGVAQPYVIPDPSSATSQSAQCPPNSGITDLHDPYFGNYDLMCSYVAPPPPQACPPGTHWDPATETCVANLVIIPPPIIIPPPPPPDSPPPPLSQPDPDGDEITNTLCAQMAANAAAIVAAINNLNTAAPGADQDACCKAVVTAIAGISSSIGLIFNLLSSKGFNVAPVNNFSPAITIDVPAGPAPTVNVNAEPTDISSITKAITDARIQHDATDAWLQALINTGAVPPDLATLYQGLDFDGVMAGAAHLVGYVLGVGLKDSVEIVERIFSFIIKPVAGVIWKLLTDVAAGFNLGDGTAVQDIANAAKSVLAGIDKAITTIFGGAANLVLEGYEAGITGIDTTTEAGVSQVVQILLGRAFELGAGAHLLATLPELAYFTKNLGLNATAALLAELAGFHEVMIQVHRPFMTAAIGRPAAYSFNRKFTSNLPGSGPALTLYARRKMLAVDTQHLLDSAGYNRTWQSALFAGAYRPISPRALATLTLDQPFDRTQMQEILEDNSMSPDHVQFMLTQLEYNSTKNVRAQYIAEAETAYKTGVVGDQEMTQILGDAGWSSAAIQLVKSKILLQRRVTLASEIEKQVGPLVQNGNISPDQGLQQLEAAGVQDWYAQLVIGLATVRAEIAAAKLEAREEAKLELSRQRNLTRAAVAEFQRGVIDSAGLTATLALIGLDPTLVTSIVAVQDATRTGRMRLLYGQLLNPEDAKVLSDRVSAIEGQFKKQLLTLDQTRAQLDALNVDGPERDALLARWAAAITAVSKNAYLVNPLTGQKTTPP